MYGDPIFENIEDNLEPVHQKFLNRRSIGLHRRFPGWYRAVVVETNDPLQIRRVRVRIPELHNSDVETEDLPWALPAPWMGGINAGSWANSIIDDIVFVCYENNHSYAPIYCATADPTRRRMYSMWSIYTRSPQAVDEEGNPAESPTEFLQDYLPKDGRPMSSGLSDRYGNFLNFSAYGFSPRQHKVNPASVGTDALSKRNYNVNKEQPQDNDPDLKYLTMGTKYGHTAIFGDQGYQWFNEFEGEFEKDKQFEQDRYQYLLKYFNEQQPKDRDQRRIDIRTRLGHKLEMRDVGWDKSREGEYGESKEIGDSQDRDERWIKLRTKGGHLFQMLDVGFDPENDVFYKRLNQAEFGDEVDEEPELGEDQRMIRFITRHGNMLVLDDRGSDPIDARKEMPHGNGFLLRSRKGFQCEANDKPEADRMQFISPKDQIVEINDRFQYILLSTTQSGEIHTESNPTSLRTRERRSLYSEVTGQTHDPLGNTYHMVLDKQNCMIRIKDPNGAGMEIRGSGAPCGEWTETRDKDDRMLWLSPTDKIVLLRDMPGFKYVLLDENDDTILIRNEEGRIQIRAKNNIELKSDKGNILMEAPNGEIGFRTKKIAATTNGTDYVFDARGFGSTRRVQGQILEEIPRGESPPRANNKQIGRKKPNDFDTERGCDSRKSQKGRIPTEVFISPPGGGGGGGLSGSEPPTDPPNPVPTAPSQPGANVPPAPEPSLDPISAAVGGGGVLWYGTTDLFLEEIRESGLLLNSLSNNLNSPVKQDADEFHLAKSLETARGAMQAILAQKRYGGKALILRIRSVEDADLLTAVKDNENVLAYKGSIDFERNIEIYEIGEVELTQPPLFPNIN